MTHPTDAERMRAECANAVRRRASSLHLSKQHNDALEAAKCADLIETIPLPPTGDDAAHDDLASKLKAALVSLINSLRRNAPPALTLTILADARELPTNLAAHDEGAGFFRCGECGHLGPCGCDRCQTCGYGIGVRRPAPSRPADDAGGDAADRLDALRAQRANVTRNYARDPSNENEAALYAACAKVAAAEREVAAHDDAGDAVRVARERTMLNLIRMARPLLHEPSMFKRDRLDHAVGLIDRFLAAERAERERGWCVKEMRVTAENTPDGRSYCMKALARALDCLNAVQRSSSTSKHTKGRITNALADIRRIEKGD